MRRRKGLLVFFVFLESEQVYWHRPTLGDSPPRVFSSERDVHGGTDTIRCLINIGLSGETPIEVNVPRLIIGTRWGTCPPFGTFWFRFHFLVFLHQSFSRTHHSPFLVPCSKAAKIFAVFCQNSQNALEEQTQRLIFARLFQTLVMFNADKQGNQSN